MKKKILLIGGSSKVGQCMINNLDQKKYLIYSTYFKKKIKKKGIIQYKLNLYDKLNNQDFIDKIPNVDFIIFLSGVLKGKSLQNFSDEEIIENFKINFLSQIILLKNILKNQKNNCLLVFLSSISGRRGSYDPIYAASKGAMISFIKSVSKWEAPRIRSIGICPGLINNSKMYKSFTKERLKKLKIQNPNKSFIDANNLAKIIVDVIQPHWKHANGSIIDVNGGEF